MSRTKNLKNQKKLNFHGLPQLGYADHIPLSGDMDSDQLAIEMVCFRIGHRRREGGLGKFGHFKKIVDLCWNDESRPSPKRFIWCREAEKILRECCRREELGVAGPTSLGKCWAPDTPILRYDGTTCRADEVKTGDLLMGDDSTPRTVQEIHVGRGPMYRVTPKHGDPWECNGDHVLVLHELSDVGVRSCLFEMSVRAYLSLSNKFRKSVRQQRIMGAEVEEVEFHVEPIDDGDWVGFSVDGNHRLLLGDFTVTHNSDPAALWSVVNFMVDPTHTKVLIMSTTIDGAKMRIWKTMREYISALPDFPGKPLWSTNRLLGPNYAEDGFEDSAGIYLLAGEKSKEKDALERLIGIKAPRTGESDDTIEALKARPEFADLTATLDDDTLADLLPRLVNLTADRIGKIIFCIDEATGIVDSILNAIRTNMKPGNPGHMQTLMLGNPNLHWDVFGQFCEPKAGWDKVKLTDYEWETQSGSWCIRFNAEQNSRIKDRNGKLSWMLTTKEIDSIAEEYGRESLYYYRFVLGMWCPQGSELGIYSQGDIEQSGAMGLTTWGYQVPSEHSSLDPSFTVGGDKPSCTFFKYGDDISEKKVMEVTEQVAIKIDAGNQDVPVSYQIVREWKKECMRRGIPARNACFDATGGGVPFAGIVHMEWSPQVQAISSGGKASARPVGGERNPDKTRLLAHQRFANKTTEMWYAAHPFFQTGQIKGITPTLAKEICSRLNAEKQGGSGRTVQAESKREFKKREGNSPDDSDSFFLGIEHLKTRFGFKPMEGVVEGGATAEAVARAGSPWEKFKARARKLSVKTNLPR